MSAVEVQYEKVQAEYGNQAAQGVPMSVHERYRRELAGLREELRAEPHNRRLGEILLDMGAIDGERLSQALEEQRAAGEGRLLGEILVDRAWVQKEAISRAVKRQVNREEMVTA